MLKGKHFFSLKKHLLVRTKLVEGAFLWEMFLGGEKKKFFFVWNFQLNKVFLQTNLFGK